LEIDGGKGGNGSLFPPSFSFLFGRKEKEKEAKRKEKPNDSYKLNIKVLAMEIPDKGILPRAWSCSTMRA
jgi:hypothetical protein